jgi:ATP sulfurylase
MFNIQRFILNINCLARVVNNLRLADGTLFPIPVNLDVSQEDAKRLGIKPGVRITLRDPRDDNALAILTVDDVYTPDKVHEAKTVFGQGEDDHAHPSISYLHKHVKELYVGGKVQGIQKPVHFDYVDLRCKFPSLLPWSLFVKNKFRYARRTSLSFLQTIVAKSSCISGESCIPS